MWHKVPELKEYVQALKQSQTQQPVASSPSDISPFSKHIINIAGCQHTMIALPPGSFWMGNQNIDAESDEKPRHRVNLTRGFLLGQTQLTQDLYEVVEGFNPSQFKPYPNHPVERVSWIDVVQWCNKLSDKQGLRPAYEITESNGKVQVSWNMQSDGYRLPTEAEWEYAARAASNFNYAGSNRPDEVAWFGASRRREGQRTYRVAQKQPNGWDFYDMSGNVWEWCWEDARGYQAGESSDPVGTTETSSRVCRGGSNYLDARQTRCSYRMRYDINYRSVFVGFRIARSLI
jgi:formylglycine-generating enzyme required for sulfatase activity